MNLRDQIRNYAKLAVKIGLNVQPGQPVLIQAPVEGADFTRLVIEEAYQAGASDVYVDWHDDATTRLRHQYASDEALKTYPQWKADGFKQLSDEGVAHLSIRIPNPDLLADIDSERNIAAERAVRTALRPFMLDRMNDRVAWSIVSIPNEAWAKKVFPNIKNVDEAIEKLWQAVLKATRADQPDPIAAWKEHNATLKSKVNELNNKRYAKLYFQGPGTDLLMSLPQGHVWKGGSAKAASHGQSFMPNIPTEEVFTMPHRAEVEGTVTNTLPLNYNGNLIDGFTLTFKEGQVVDYKAEKGAEVLKGILETDEGARRLGEVALVPVNSPIYESGLIFYNTLYDENASCHIALGAAYPTNIENGENMGPEELEKHGVHTSLTHVDFMIGSPELNIDGIDKDGRVEPLFRNGRWV